MRIVAGTFKGRTIVAPPGNDTRPTTDRVREALFSSLYSMRGGLEGAVVLDAFAGSGALGLEALSRGARAAWFFERDSKAADVVRANLAACGVPRDAAVVMRRDVMAAPPADAAASFDVVFADPPYACRAADVFALMAELARAGVLAPGATVVYEHARAAAKDVHAAADAAGFDAVATRTYGKTAVTFCEERS